VLPAGNEPVKSEKIRDWKSLRMNDADLKHLGLAIALSHSARAHGNEPYGAVLVDGHGRVLLRAENTQVTDRDCTAHAEISLLREATRRFEPETLAGCTLYASGEPCPMCASAIYRSNVRRVVFALDSATMVELDGPDADQLMLTCREVFARGTHPVEVLGPALQDEARKALENR
jgi:tRNA(adenine34) deaminase